MTEDQKQRQRETNVRWRKRNPDKARDFSRRWKQQNPDKVLAQRLRDRNPEREKERRRNWYYRNVAHSSRFFGLKKCCPKRGLVFALDHDTFVAWWNATPDVCTYCQLSLEEVRIKFADRPNRYRQQMTVDRVDAMRGYEQDNIVKACFSCNFEKGFTEVHRRRKAK